MSAAGALRFAKGELARLAHSGLDSFAYRERAAERLAKLVPYDGVWWWTTDPATSFFTSGIFHPCAVDRDHPELCRDIHVNEFIEEDFNKFRVLARRKHPVGILSHATGGIPERSRRYRDILRPFGFEHELRLALVEDSTCWGALTLTREAAAPDFTPADSATLAKLGQTLADGLRIGLLLGAVTVDSAADGPGLLVLDEDYRITDMNASAERWLAELDHSPWGPPEAVMALAECVKQLADRDCGEPAPTPRARVRTPSGRWLVIHGSRLRQTIGRTCVIIEEAKPSEIAPVLIAAYGLSEREAQLTRLIFQGLSTKEIAVELLLSTYTVQDYLKSAFEKVGVRSRRELVARIFDQYHWPRYGHGDQPPQSDGSVARADQPGSSSHLSPLV